MGYTRTGNLQSAVQQLLALEAHGANAAVAATSLVVTHGLTSTPTAVTATPSLNTGAWWVTAIGATTFTINWVTSSSPTWYWSARI